MPKYLCKRDTLLGHESRVVKAGDVFETTFPKVKGPHGKETDMKLGDNLELVPEDKKSDKKDDKKPGSDLV